jgi:hypothetical protein
VSALKLVNDPHPHSGLFRIGLEEERQCVVSAIASGQCGCDECGTQDTGTAQQPTSPERPRMMPLEPGMARILGVCHSANHP